MQLCGMSVLSCLLQAPTTVAPLQHLQRLHGEWMAVALASL
jgi:hypothetical protein